MLKKIKFHIIDLVILWKVSPWNTLFLLIGESFLPQKFLPNMYMHGTCKLVCMILAKTVNQDFLSIKQTLRKKQLKQEFCRRSIHEQKSYTHVEL